MNDLNDLNKLIDADRRRIVKLERQLTELQVQYDGAMFDLQASEARLAAPAPASPDGGTTGGKGGFGRSGPISYTDHGGRHFGRTCLACGQETKE